MFQIPAGKIFFNTKTHTIVRLCPYTRIFVIFQNNNRGYPSTWSPFSGFSDVLSFPFRFVSSPVFPPVFIPSPDDIKKTKPQPGQTYTGIYAQSGGGEHVILANLNGHVLEFSTYNFYIPNSSKRVFVIRLLLNGKIDFYEFLFVKILRYLHS